jgi:hypothetical protein
MSQHVDGEEEQFDLLLPLLREASKQIAADMRTPLRPKSTECLRWLAREAFRLGYQHAHSRNTKPAPEEE